MPAIVFRCFVTLAACLFLLVYILHIYMKENAPHPNATEPSCAQYAPVVITASDVPEVHALWQSLKNAPANSVQRYTTAVLDRYETGQKAVFLLEEVGEEWLLPGHTLPSHYIPNTWFDVFISQKGDIWLHMNCRKTTRESDKSDHLANQLKSGRYCPGNIDKNFSSDIQ